MAEGLPENNDNDIATEDLKIVHKEKIEAIGITMSPARRLVSEANP
jgi:hypothetical protein